MRKILYIRLTQKGIVYIFIISKYCEAQARVRQGKARKGKGWQKVKGLKA